MNRLLVTNMGLQELRDLKLLLVKLLSQCPAGGEGVEQRGSSQGQQVGPLLNADAKLLTVFGHV
ncbi:hypothetical protein E2C01_021796 [Portunus trituberculatus]|uniref:Uncharacterized protein n=1 Tax=Portunus trituberculatus TaxID=210409 RepID=A0A5B7E4C9_PORTR|nr:hypothetical protein [Portunus trituberculatus]